MPKNIEGSVHRRTKFDTMRDRVPAEPVIYSKSDLLKMILDNDGKTSLHEKQSPLISVAEAIHGNYKTNFVLNKA